MTVTNKTIAAGFVAAKKYLWKGTGKNLRKKSTYICIALINAGKKKEISEEVLDACLLVISTRLNGHSTIKTWLRSQGICAESITDYRLQEHRHAWLDWLIKEFSE